MSTKIVNENQVIVLSDLNVSGMLKNRKLARAISQQGWHEFRRLCEAKSEKFGRDFRVISRWEPTSQVCADCGFKWGKIDLSICGVKVPKTLSIRLHECSWCGVAMDRDENAARNILDRALNEVGLILSAQVGLGDTQPVKCEAFSDWGSVQLSLF